jgi:putative ATPase
VVPQAYAPDQVAGRRYYEPSRHGAEARYAERSERIREILGRGDDTGEPGQPGQPVPAEPQPGG